MQIRPIAGSSHRTQRAIFLAGPEARELLIAALRILRIQALQFESMLRSEVALVQTLDQVVDEFMRGAGIQKPFACQRRDASTSSARSHKPPKCR